MSMSVLEADAEVIHVYSRAQALADGVLVDVSTLAREAGFKVPVAVTAAVWADCVAWPAGVAGQDETGRLWDVLYLAGWKARGHPEEQAVTFGILRVPPGGTEPTGVSLQLHVGPGDQGEPVITLMHLVED